MTRPHLSRRSLLATGAGGGIGLALAAGALAPWASRNAEAQVDPSQPAAELTPGQYDPALAGTDPALGGVDPALAGTDPTLAATDTALAIPATPMVTAEAPIPEPTWEATEAGMATSLGGSDVAVASVGGSYQVDAPRRKADKVRGGKKRP